jgi:hypothetical protein
VGGGSEDQLEAASAAKISYKWRRCVAQGFFGLLLACLIGDLQAAGVVIEARSVSAHVSEPNSNGRSTKVKSCTVPQTVGTRQMREKKTARSSQVGANDARRATPEPNTTTPLPDLAKEHFLSFFPPRIQAPVPAIAAHMELAVRAPGASCSSYPSLQRARVPGRLRRSPGLTPLPARQVAVAATIAVDPVRTHPTFYR